nr:hypothetical protein [Pseudomonas syringae]
MLEVQPGGMSGGGLGLIDLVKRVKTAERLKHRRAIGLAGKAPFGVFSGHPQVWALAALSAQCRVLLKAFEPRMVELDFAEAQLDIHAPVIPVGRQPDIIQPFTGGQAGIVGVLIANAKLVQFNVVVSGALIRDADFEFAPQPTFHEHIQVAGAAEYGGAVVLCTADPRQRDEGQDRDNLVPLHIQLSSGDTHFRQRQFDDPAVFFFNLQHHAMAGFAIPVPDVQRTWLAHPGRDGFRLIFGSQRVKTLSCVLFINGQPLGGWMILADHLNDEFVDFTARATAQVADVVSHLRISRQHRRR